MKEIDMSIEEHYNQTIKHLKDKIDELQTNNFEDENEIIVEQRKRIIVLEEALQSIKNELGVPQPGCPSPVANAYEIAEITLAKEEEHETL